MPQQQVAPEQDQAPDAAPDLGAAMDPMGNQAGCASLPPPDGAPVASILALAARSFGQPLDVQVVPASPVAAQAGSAGIAIGNVVHIHPMATGPDGTVSAQVLAHELVHVVQQQGEADAGGSTANLGGEASDQVDAVLSGRPVDVAGSAAYGTPQHETLAEWFRENWDQATGASTDAGAVSDDNLLIMSTDGEIVHAEPSGPESVEVDELPPAGPADDAGEDGKITLSDQSNTTQELTPDDDGAVTGNEVTSISRTTLDLSKGTISHTTGMETKPLGELDEEAKKAVAVSQLKQKVSELDPIIASTRQQITDIDNLAAGLDASELTPEEVAQKRQEYQDQQAKLREKVNAAETAKTQLVVDTDALEKGDIDLLTAEGRHDIDFSDAETPSRETTWSVGGDGLTWARESEGVDGSKDEKKVDVSVSGATLEHTTTDVLGTKTTAEGGVDLSEGIGVDGSTSTKNKDGSGASANTKVDLVVDEKKGLQGIKTENGLTMTDKDGLSQTATIRQTLTTDQIGGGATVGATQKLGDADKDGGSFGVKLGGDAGIDATVKPQPDGRFQLSVTLHGNIDFGGSAEGHTDQSDAGNGKVGADVSVGGSASLTFTRLLDKAAAEQYFGDLEAGGDGEYPEFGWVGKLRGAAGMQTGFDDPDTAANLGVGESHEFQAQISAKACLSAGWSWVSADVGVNGSGTWTQAVSRDDKGTHYTQGVSTQGGKSADGELTTGDGVSASAGFSDTTTVGLTVSGTLDLSTEEGKQKYGAIMAARDLDSLLAAGQAAGATVSQQSGEETVTKMGVGIGPVSLGDTQTSSTDETVSTGPDGMEADVSGEAGDDMKLDVAGHQVAHASETDKADLHVDDEGLDATFSRETETTGAHQDEPAEKGGSDRPRGRLRRGRGPRPARRAEGRADLGGNAPRELPRRPEGHGPRDPAGRRQAQLGRLLQRGELSSGLA